MSATPAAPAPGAVSFGHLPPLQLATLPVFVGLFAYVGPGILWAALAQGSGELIFWPYITAKYGGKFIARGGKIDVLEGDWSPKRVVICEFESIERAREWYESEEYRPAMEIRQKTATAKIIVIDGL